MQSLSNRLKLVSETARQRIEIVDMGDDGFAVLRYEGSERASTTHDYLQDDLESAMECAEEEFGVRREDWRNAALNEVSWLSTYP